MAEEATALTGISCSSGRLAVSKESDSITGIITHNAIKIAIQGKPISTIFSFLGLKIDDIIFLINAFKLL